MFSKRASKIDKIFTVFTVKLMVKILSIFVAFLEDMSFKSMEWKMVNWWNYDMAILLVISKALPVPTSRVVKKKILLPPYSPAGAL